MAITLTTSPDGENGEKAGKERERASERGRDRERVAGILSSPRFLKTYTEMITSATTVAGGCVIYLRIPISTPLLVMLLLSECNCTRISLRCNIEEANSAFFPDFNFLRPYTRDAAFESNSIFQDKYFVETSCMPRVRGVYRVSS